MKNIILVHLESLNYVTWKNHDDWFKCLRKNEPESIVYTNYYSSATSTKMVLADIVYGDMTIFESMHSLKEMYQASPDTEPLFGFLKKHGYQTKCFYQSWNTVGDFENSHKLFFEDSQSWDGDDTLEFEQEFEDSLAVGVPFAFFVADASSHVSYCGKRYDNEIEPYDQYKARFQRLDETVGIIFDILRKKNCLDDTVIVMYGDHGDDYWFHSFHDGYTHAIEPFSDICHCPLIIYNASETLINDLPSDSLLSSIDIRKIIMNCLELEKGVPFHKYVFSRNLFAAQTKKENVFIKSYAVRNGTYLLLWSNKGYSMFMEDSDPYSMNNVLRFFKFNGTTLNYNDIFEETLSKHFEGFFPKELIKDIEKQFYELKKELDDFLVGINVNISKKYRIQGIDRRINQRKSCLHIKRKTKMRVRQWMINTDIIKIYRKIRDWLK